MPSDHCAFAEPLGSCGREIVLAQDFEHARAHEPLHLNDFRNRQHRDRQDEIALASHRNAVAAREVLAREIVPLEDVSQDSGPRDDTSLEALSGLRPVFDPEGTITAGNASPVTDGASAVLLMRENRAKAEGREPLAYLRAMDYAAIDPAEGLLMAPAITVPRILERTGVRLRDIDLIEIHEAFAAQVLSNVQAWGSAAWAERLGLSGPVGEVDWGITNVMGGSIAVGHPFAATGCRLVTTLANEMKRRDVQFGLISICAQGGMGFAMVLERR